MLRANFFLLLFLIKMRLLSTRNCVEIIPAMIFLILTNENYVNVVFPCNRKNIVRKILNSHIFCLSKTIVLSV